MHDPLQQAYALLTETLREGDREEVQLAARVLATTAEGTGRLRACLLATGDHARFLEMAEHYPGPVDAALAIRAFEAYEARGADHRLAGMLQAGGEHLDPQRILPRLPDTFALRLLLWTHRAEAFAPFCEAVGQAGLAFPDVLDVADFARVEHPGVAPFLVQVLDRRLHDPIHRESGAGLRHYVEAFIRLLPASAAAYALLRLLAHPDLTIQQYVATALLDAGISSRRLLEERGRDFQPGPQLYFWADDRPDVTSEGP